MDVKTIRKAFEMKLASNGFTADYDEKIGGYQTPRLNLWFGIWMMAYKAALSTIDHEGKPDHWPSWKAKAEEMERNWLGATETHNQARKMYDEQNARMWAMARRPEAPEGFVQRMLHMSREDQDYILSMGIDKHLADPDAIRRECAGRGEKKFREMVASPNQRDIPVFKIFRDKQAAELYAAILGAKPVREETCWKCDGRGKLRNNTHGPDGYKFGFISCDECEGSGTIEISGFPSEPAQDDGKAEAGESDESKDERLALKQQLGAGCHDECGELPEEEL